PHKRSPRTVHSCSIRVSVDRGDHRRPLERGRFRRDFGCRSLIQPFTTLSAAALLATVVSHIGSSRRMFASANHTAKRYRPSGRMLILYLKPRYFSITRRPSPAPRALRRPDARCRRSAASTQGGVVALSSPCCRPTTPPD